MPPNRPTLRRGSVVLVSAIAVALASPTQPASAQAASPPGESGLGTVDLNGLDSGTHEVTLITGDTVTLSSTGGDHFSVTVENGNRPAGSPPVDFLFDSTPEHSYVYPTDAVPLVRAGIVDRALFDVKYLADNGYADDQSDSLPVIAEYQNRNTTDFMAAADALPASTATAELTSVDGAAMTVAKDQAEAFWATVRGQSAEGGLAATGLGAGLTGLWLDRKVHVTLDESVPLIGAPTAWDMGLDGTGVKVAVLDTGIDLDHPDLADQVAESQSFVPGQSVDDRFGHGTHVASTIAGTGAASGGQYRGVAPGAKLVVGKVLDNSGNGQSSWIIDGMEWAAHSGARVVSMSLGGPPTDGTDALSQAVNDLTASTGTLFVVAAGNAGRDGARTVEAPGTADAALTVAATDKSDGLADFSSRGPRFIDDALKPDIAAPGVDITAARSTGTNMGGNATPVDENYITASGTSMATPHVAGAAAILAQEHPDWSPEQLKATLMSTSTDDGFTVYEQGAGRLDVAAAVTQSVLAQTAHLDFADVADPAGPIDKTVTYVNPTDQPVTLTLTPSLSTADGTAADSALSVQPSLTVPVGGTASATLTLDPAGLDHATYSGAITAETDHGHLTTPIGVVIGDPAFTLTVRTTGIESPVVQTLTTDISAVDVPATEAGTCLAVDIGVCRARVRPGTYAVSQWLSTQGEDAQDHWTLLANPQVTITGDTEIELDARDANPVTVSLPRPAVNYARAVMSVERSRLDGSMKVYAVVTNPGDGAVSFAATPTPPITQGVFRFSTEWQLGNPQLTMRVRGPHGYELNPVTAGYQDKGVTFGNSFGYRPFDGATTTRVVDVGLGNPEDIPNLDLDGKLALLELDIHECVIHRDQVRALRDAGAIGILAFPSRGDSLGCWEPIQVDLAPSQTPDLPSASITPSQGHELRDRLADGPVRIDIHGNPNIDYLYWTRPFEEGRIPDSLDYSYGSDQFAKYASRFHSDQPTRLLQHWSSWAPGTTYALTPVVGFAGPGTRTDYFGPVNSDVFYEGGIDSYGIPDDTSYLGTYLSPVRAYDRPTMGVDQWGVIPRAPGGIDLDAIAKAQPDTSGTLHITPMYRQGDTFYPVHQMMEPGGTYMTDPMMDADARLYSDGREIPRVPLGEFGTRFPVYTLSKGPATYQLDLNVENTATRWTFNSAESGVDTHQVGSYCFNAESFPLGSADPCQPQPTVLLTYDLGDRLRLDNTVDPHGTHQIVVHAAHPPSTGEMPPIAGLTLSTSRDGGQTWTPAHVTRHGDDFIVTVNYITSGAHAPGDSVSIRAEAWDFAGNRVEQTITDAYTLRDDRGHGGNSSGPNLPR